MRLVLAILFTFSLCGCNGQDQKKDSYDEPSNGVSEINAQPSAYTHSELSVSKNEFYFYFGEEEIFPNGEKYDLGLFSCFRNNATKCTLFGMSKKLNNVEIDQMDIPLTEQAQTIPFESIDFVPNLAIGICGKINDEYKCKVGEQALLWPTFDVSAMGCIAAYHDNCGDIYKKYLKQYSFKSIEKNAPLKDAVISFSELFNLAKPYEVKRQVAFFKNYGKPHEFFWINSDQGLQLFFLKLRGNRSTFSEGSLTLKGQERPSKSWLETQKNIDKVSPPCFKSGEKIFCATKNFDYNPSVKIYNPQFEFELVTNEAQDLHVLRGPAPYKYNRKSSELDFLVAYHTPKGLEINGQLISGIPAGLTQLTSQDMTQYGGSIIVLCGKSDEVTQCFQVDLDKNKAINLSVGKEILYAPDLVSNLNKVCGVTKDQIYCSDYVSRNTLQNNDLLMCAGINPIPANRNIHRPQFIWNFGDSVSKRSTCTGDYSLTVGKSVFHFFKGVKNSNKNTIFVQKCDKLQNPDLNFADNGSKKLSISMDTLDLVKYTGDGYLLGGSTKKYSVVGEYSATVAKLNLSFDLIPGVKQVYDNMSFSHSISGYEQLLSKVIDIVETDDSFIVNGYINGDHLHPRHFRSIQFEALKNGNQKIKYNHSGQSPCKYRH